MGPCFRGVNHGLSAGLWCPVLVCLGGRMVSPSNLSSMFSPLLQFAHSALSLVVWVALLGTRNIKSDNDMYAKT